MLIFWKQLKISGIFLTNLADVLNAGKHFLIQTERIRKICPNCVRAKLLPQPARLRHEPPEMVISFQIQPANLPSIYANFTKGVWLHSDDFETGALLNRTTAIC